MKMTVESKKDLQFLQGKFVLQINNETPDKTLMDFDWGFAKEKRLMLVCGNGFVDLYGYIYDSKTFEKFQRVFNNYLFDHMVKEGKTDGGRFHRLLTNKELDYLLEKMKENNY